MAWYRHLLWPVAALYGLGVWIRNRLFDYEILRTHQFEIPIICVGNLETGGTGKSPLVNCIVQVLVKDGRNVAVLSRGYGRLTKGFLLVDESSSASEVGDEPLQLKRRLPHVTVAVCENRALGIENLLKSSKPQVIVMDDGFQHRWVTPTLSILVTPFHLPFWKNNLLPVGTLREASSESKRADLLVVSGSTKKEKIDSTFDGEIFQSSTISGELVQFSGEIMNVSEIEEVVLFSGIANEQRFEESVSEYHQVQGHLKFSDHHNYTLQDLSRLRKLDSFGAAVNAVITTEKDAARLANFPILNELKHIPMFYLPISIDFGESASEFNKKILGYGKHA